MDIDKDKGKKKQEFRLKLDDQLKPVISHDT